MSETRPHWGEQLPQLYAMWVRGIPVHEIAERLGRSEFSVRRKADQKGLGPHPKERAA